MTRKIKTIKIADEGRDKDKTFVIQEMCASQAEEWAWKALEAIAIHTEIPAGIRNAGMLGIFILGLKPLLAAPFKMKKELLDEMFQTCLSIEVAPGRLRGAGTKEIKNSGSLIEEDIEEVATRVLLRSEIIELHVGFSPAAYLSQSWTEVVEVATFIDAKMSRTQSAQSSPGTQA